jgi:hypothetical protein
MFRKLDLFPSSGEERETPTLLAPLERANLGPMFDASFVYGWTDRICIHNFSGETGIHVNVCEIIHREKRQKQI